MTSVIASGLRRAVFLDRDGVLDEPVATPGGERPPWSVEELTLVPGAAESCDLLRRAGYMLIAVSNQPDIGRGQARATAVDEVNRVLAAELGLDDVVMCPHGGRPACTCRKPEPGLLVTSADRHGIALEWSWLVGDRWVDIAAGRAAGVRTILVDRPGSWSTTSAGPPPVGLDPDETVADVLAAARLIVALHPHRPT